MLFLLLATIASAGNALTMKFAGSRSKNSWSLLFFNYLVASALSLASFARSGVALPEVTPREWALGVVNGLLYIASFALMQLNVLRNGATVTSSTARMGAVIPMLLSIALFGEYPSPAGAAGIAVAIMATALLALPRTKAPDAAGPASSVRALLIPMVLASGIADTMSKVFEATSEAAHGEAFILTTFATALTVCLVMLLRAHERPSGIDIACGSLLGIFNFFSSDLMLRALMELPAHVVYTGFSMGVVLITYFVNALFMHERLSKRDHAAIVLVVIALILINLPR